MIQIDILNNADYIQKSWVLQNITDNQIIISLKTHVNHFHAIRFPEKKIIWITNLEEKEINYFIEFSPLKSESEQNLCNETSFFFGGADKSFYLFSNLIISGKINTPFRYIKGTNKQLVNNENLPEEQIIEINELGELPCKELLFMQISHNSKITFFNCVFQNNTDKIFVIETWHDAVVEFINCDFAGNFSFNSNHNSMIIK